MITQEELKELFNYDSESGLFTRAKKQGSRGKVGDIAGSKRNTGYITIKVKGKQYQAHRLVWLYMTGEFPESDIDHINHVRDDNRWENLRETSRVVNCQNMSKSNANTSGCTGVAWSKENNKWLAYINIEGKRSYLGYHIEYSEAVNARQNAEVLYGFHENHGKDK